LISAASYAAGRRFGGLVAIARRGWNLQEASVNDLWRRMVAGTSGGVGIIPVTAGSNPADDDTPDTVDELRRKLEDMRKVLWHPGEQGELYFAVLAITVDLAWPAWLKRVVLGSSTYQGDFRHFGLVKEGLHRLAELRTSRPRRDEPIREMAAE
jgi:hypothetical protein